MSFFLDKKGPKNQGFPSGGRSLLRRDMLFEGPKSDLCPFFLIKKDQKIKAQQKFA
jgi:hypothetical protein